MALLSLHRSTCTLHLLWRTFLFVSICLSFANAVETLSPEEEQKTFQLADGFQINLYASEELGVLNPMQMRWDADGRLFVISTLGYPHLRPGEKPNDKIIMLTDRDGDGVADESTVFADGLNIPTGLEPGHGGLYVGEQTELVFLKDTDGDGKADHREVILSGFGVGDTHQAINSFVWSPGGELYFDQGDGIESRVETPWGLSGLYQAGVMRLRPRRLQLDPFLDDFMGPGNPWGIAFDDWGQTFVVDGAGGITFLSPAMMPVHHRHRLRTIGKPGGYCGVDVLGSQHLPDGYQGDLVVGDFQRSRIGRFAVVPQDAGFALKWKDPVVVSTHRNFRPVDVRVGPDGAIYVCDWYNSIICHQDDPFRHPDRDFAHGRIWRISHKHRPVQKQPKLYDRSITELLTQLKSPERWVRYQAKAVLADRERSEVGKRVSEFWKECQQPTDHLLLELVGVLESVESVNGTMLDQLFAAEDYRGRAYAARVVGRWHDRLENPIAILQRLVHDSHPLVRMEAVVACAHVPSPHAAEVAAEVIDYDLDYDTDYALSQALQHLKQQWVPAFQRGDLTFGGKPNRLAGVLQRVRSKELVDSLRRLARSKQFDLPTRMVILETLCRVGNADDVSVVCEAAIEYPEYAKRLLTELASAHSSRSLVPSENPARFTRLLESELPEVKSLALQLVGRWEIAEHFSTVADSARDSGNTVSVRRAAMNALGRMGGVQAERLLAGLTQSTKVSIRLPALAALGRCNVERAARSAASWLSTNPPLRESHYKQLLRGFKARQQGLERFYAELSKTELSPSTARLLLNALNVVDANQASLVRFLTDVARLSDSLPVFSEQVVKEIVQSIPQGDPHRGEQVFRRKTTNCYACHQIGGAGGVVGPDLSAVGTTLPLDRLVQEVLWPRRQVKEGYNLKQVVTEDGEVLQGYQRKSRDKRVLLLRQTDSELVVRVNRDAIEGISDVGSAMPENIVATLTSEERMDLLAFLSQLGQVGEFGLSERHFIRQWQVKRGENWEAEITNLSGELPIGAAPTMLKTVFETTGTKQRLVFDDVNGLELWLDGQMCDVDKNMVIELEPGKHELRVAVNARQSKTIRAEWQTIE